MRFLGVYGAGGAGRGVMPILRASAERDDTIVFVDDNRAGERINAHTVMDLAGFSALAGDRRIALALAAPPVRKRLADNVVEMDDVQRGEGAILSPFVTLTSNIRIGRHFHANLYSYVEHDCVLGDFVTFAPSVRCNGNVSIGDCS